MTDRGRRTEALHCIALHYITLHYITLHYITLHYITLHYITLHYITLGYMTLHNVISYANYTYSDGASTKSSKFSECELKKVSFQKFSQSISVCEFLEIERKRIPCLRFGERESPLAELKFQPWKFISEAAGGSQSLPTRQVSVGCHHVQQARRATTNSHQVLEHAELVDSAEPDRKPV